jgi:uncharacterized protein (DUF58 family)
VTRAATPKLRAYATLSAAGLLAALVTGRPELVALTAPFLLALAAGLALATTPRFELAAEVADERALEGDETGVAVAVAAASPVAELDVYLRLPPDVELVEGTNPAALHLARGEQRRLDLRIRAGRWGGHVLGPLVVRAHDPVGLATWERTLPSAPALRVYPREEVLRRVLPPRETQLYAGNEVSHRKGEGIEFADVRPRAPGDPLKRINWRASARRGELWVNESHPERNTDVILFVDSFAEARRDRESTLGLAVRATAALADAYVRRRDRVGLISFGGILRWLVPGTGLVQLYRIADALIDTQIVLSYYWRDLDVIPVRTLPPSALVIALSPLLDQRSVGALLDLRARGFDLAVVDVSPVPFATRPGGLDGVAYDIWELRRDALRHRLQRAGVAVAEWVPGRPLQAVLEEVRAFRRYARLARA